MIWLIYILTSVLISFLIARLTTSYFFAVFIISLFLFLTPAQIEVGGQSYAPSLFLFFFTVFFEHEYSLRALRPLFLTLPICFSLLLLFYYLKRRFF